MSPEETWLSRKAAAMYLTRLGCPITHRTLEKMASNSNAGGGPPFTRAGWKAVRYNQVDLDKWAKKRMVRID
jgi:hypothetical protein